MPELPEAKNNNLQGQAHDAGKALGDISVSTVLATEPDKPSDPLPSIRVAPSPSEKYKTDGSILDAIATDLERQGERINPIYIDRMDDERLINGLSRVCEQSGTTLGEYIKHSNRFSLLDRWNGLHDRENKVTIPEGPDNLHRDGSLRRKETHDGFNMDYVREQGIDPGHVLYFRVTQPSDQPKPEYYWTSDFTEVNHGLNAEGSRQGNPVILVSTLADIARNGGLMIDVNDDSGIAVRQIGLEPYDQTDALLSYSL